MVKRFPHVDRRTLLKGRLLLRARELGVIGS